MLVINGKSIDTNRKLTTAVKAILGKEYKVYRDFWLFVEGKNLDQAKKELEEIGLTVEADFWGGEIGRLFVFLPTD